MEFLTGIALHRAVERVLNNKAVKCAVAFWGAGAESLFGVDVKEARIICNLSMGGTNPTVIENLMKRYDVRQCDALHAKVYIGDSKAVVGSANASTGGLGFEGKKGWIEGGVEIQKVEPIVEWFDALWRDADATREISVADLESAKQRFARIQAALQPSHVVVWSEKASPEALKAAEQAEQEENIGKLYLYEDWKAIPHGATLIDYQIKNGVASFTGQFQTFLPPLEKAMPNGKKIKLCKRIRLSGAQKKVYQSAAWKYAANLLYKTEGESVVPFSVFADRFLNGKAAR